MVSKKMRIAGLLAAGLMLVSTPAWAVETGSGERVSTRIYNGNIVADPNPYPWMTALLSASESDPFQAQFCGGSLVADHLVLTAAHCVDGARENQVQVAVGFLNLSDIRSSDRQAVSEIIVHPDWDATTTDNDIALLVLSDPSRNASVTKIPLISESTVLSAGDAAKAVGWGQIETGGYPDALREGDMEITADDGDSCPPWPSEWINPETMLCALGSVPAAESQRLLASSKPQTRIIGGTLADISDAPWQVGLVYNSAPSDYAGQFCGGSILSETWILTAAHCLDSGVTAAELSVVYGTADLSRAARTGIDVARFIIHPDWNDSTNDNDVALIELESPMSLSVGTAQAIDLPLGRPAVGSTALITGWGNRSTTIQDYPDSLYKANVEVFSDEYCDSYYGSYSGDLMVCATASDFSRDTCQGDSGGPLAVYSGGRWEIQGITSFGVGCAQSPFPGVYAEVYEYISWIESTMDSESGDLIDACFGDSGGPLLIQEGGQWVLAGATSWGSETCGADGLPYPGVWARVSNYLDWIETELYPTPVFTSFSPTRGAPGSSVTLRGANFQVVTDVLFNGVSTSFTISSATQIRATVPSTSSGRITLVYGSGEVESRRSYSVVYPRPSVSRVSPTAASVGDTVTVTGRGFTGLTNVRLSGVEADFTVDSDRRLTFVVPEGASTGRIQLSNPGQTLNYSRTFTVLPPAGWPQLTRVNPSSARVGSAVTISGLNFEGTTAVTFNGTSAVDITVVSNSSLRVIVPVGARSGRIAVTNALGTTESSFTIRVRSSSRSPWEYWLRTSGPSYG